MQEKLRIETRDGNFEAYLARPDVLPAPVVVVLHEVFGVNADMRQTCDELAAQGYIAVCPDLHWRTQPGIAMTDRTQAELDRAFELYTAFDWTRAIDDIAETLMTVRTMPGSNGRIGLLGFCMGGLLSLLATARFDIDAAVAYYPGGADQHADQLRSIDTPTLVHMAEADEYIPPAAQQTITEALAGRDEVRVHGYPGMSHAFTRRGGAHYDAGNAVLANGRTRDFLAARLK